MEFQDECRTAQADVVAETTAPIPQVQPGPREAANGPLADGEWVCASVFVVGNQPSRYEKDLPQER
jgi:hypothetical protein